MAEKFQNKYRVPSARLQNWNYGANGAYFITICTKEMQHFFGEVVDKKMILNLVGALAEEYWTEILKQFPYVELGNFQIMPNHMHGILIIDKSVVAVETRFIASNLGERIDDVDISETRLIASVPEKDGIGGFAGENNPMLADNISRIIRWYKGRCTFEMRKKNPNFGWHSRFHDHIIRNSESFERIQNYIEENPARWEEDKFYKK
ncbi:transposase [Flavobacterium franklandianum]|uniref:Transposase n=1 Tax=Flavobacterium franklandianum TaxID=2594430 RepID=A0A553C6Y5_9FLAO|nr:transposase [Flavobacterium franklandianum]TRX16172.1 transposase [Flavobacterium franklandianum]